jgi:hypothetical protein
LAVALTICSDCRQRAWLSAVRKSETRLPCPLRSGARSDTVREPQMRAVRMAEGRRRNSVVRSAAAWTAVPGLDRAGDGLETAAACAQPLAARAELPVVLPAATFVPRSDACTRRPRRCEERCWRRWAEDRARRFKCARGQRDAAASAARPEAPDVLVYRTLPPGGLNLPRMHGSTRRACRRLVLYVVCCSCRTA